MGVHKEVKIEQVQLHRYWLKEPQERNWMATEGSLQAYTTESNINLCANRKLIGNTPTVPIGPK